MAIAAAPYSTAGIKKAIALTLTMMVGDGAMACLWRAMVRWQRAVAWMQPALSPAAAAWAVGYSALPLKAFTSMWGWLSRQSSSANSTVTSRLSPGISAK